MRARRSSRPGSGSFSFNALLEIPHFFAYARAGTPTEGLPGVWECVQDAASPLWLKRLPFFFSYFVGCSWSSAALAYRAFRVGGGGRHARAAGCAGGAEPPLAEHRRVARSKI